MQLSNKPTDRTNAFVENERQSKEKQRAVGNVEPVWLKKGFCKNITTRHLIEWYSIKKSRKISTSKQTVKRRLGYIAFASLEVQKIMFFAKNSPKRKVRGPKLSKKTDREPVVMFIQKSDESDPLVPRKLDSKR